MTVVTGIKRFHTLQQCKPRVKLTFLITSDLLLESLVFDLCGECFLHHFLSFALGVGGVTALELVEFLHFLIESLSLLMLISSLRIF